MKIAHIGSRGIPANYSGVEVAIEESSLRLSKKGFQPIVYCHSNKFDTSNYNNIKLIHAPAINSKHFATLIHSFLSTAHVIFTDAEIVHYHCLGPSIFSFIPRIFGKKTIVTIHAIDWKRKKWNVFVRAMFKLSEQTAIYFPNKTIVVSEYLYNYFKEKYGKVTYIVPNGVNINSIKSDETLGNYLLFVGRLVPEKGLECLIKAFNEVNINKELWIVGSSSYTDNYVNKIKDLAGANIKFLGAVFGEKLNELYKNSYAFILPSELEGCRPLVLLEAMSYGKCCIMSNIPECCIEFTENYAITFKNKDYLDLKEKIEYVVSNPEIIQKIGKKAKKFVKEKHDWDKILIRLEEVYLSLLTFKQDRTPANIQNK